MKKKNIYLLCIIVFCLAVGGIIFKYNYKKEQDEKKQYVLLERKGLLVDGNVEMGNYDTAVSYADKMVSIRPDLTSYSRVSYLREIFGDYAGSINAMQMAVEAGGAGDEHTEWTRYQLANLYQKTNNYKKADTLYQLSLSMRPNYAYAIAGLAQIAMANKDYAKAISLYEKADSVVDDYSIKEELV